jgi:DNA-binding transcriptional LysR family regulator
LSELAEDTMLQPDNPPGLSLGHTLRDVMAKAGFIPRRRMVVNEMSSTVGLVAAGMGVALLPASARVMRLPGVAFCTLQDVQAVSHLIVVHRRFERSAAARMLLDRLRLARETTA